MSQNPKTLLIRSKMIELGIVPAMQGHELKEMLSSLTKEEQRRAKRKFRKLWKKMLKKNPDIASMIIPSPGESVSKNHIRHRSVYLISEIKKEIESL